MNPSIETTANIASKPRIALIVARWHADIVDQFKTAFLTAFEHCDGRQVDIIEVPGAFEIPLLAKQLACAGNYAAVVACALVVDGGIYRHEFVANSVVQALMHVQMETNVPVFSGVLTPKDFTSEGQADFFIQHFTVKGEEAARACSETLASYQKLSRQCA